jgi:acyl-CoA thioester hydrolase
MTPTRRNSMKASPRASELQTGDLPPSSWPGNPVDTTQGLAGLGPQFYTPGMSHTTELVVRTYECDAYGHVNNANYLHYLEYARHEYLKAIGFDYAGCVARGYGLYVTRAEIDFRHPAFFDDRLTIESEAVKKGVVSGTLAQTIRHDDTVVATARISWAFVDSAGKPTRIPADLNVPGLAAQRS